MTPDFGFLGLGKGDRKYQTGLRYAPGKVDIRYVKSRRGGMSPFHFGSLLVVRF